MARGLSWHLISCGHGSSTRLSTLRGTLQQRLRCPDLGSGGASHHQDFVLTELDGGARTRVDVTVDGAGGLIRWGPLMRAMESITFRRLRKKIEASA